MKRTIYSEEHEAFGADKASLRPLRDEPRSRSTQLGGHVMSQTPRVVERALGSVPPGLELLVRNTLGVHVAEIAPANGQVCRNFRQAMHSSTLGRYGWEMS